MKTAHFFLAIAAALALLMSGCTTRIPAKTTSDDCLVMIRTITDNQSNHTELWTYKFLFSDRVRPLAVDNDKTSFVIVRIKQPGVKLINVHSEISKLHGNFFGEPFDTATDIDLPYEAGKLLIADFAFIKHSYNVNGQSDRWATDTNFKKLGTQEKAELYAMVSKMRNFRKWQGGN